MIVRCCLLYVVRGSVFVVRVFFCLFFVSFLFLFFRCALLCVRWLIDCVFACSLLFGVVRCSLFVVRRGSCFGCCCLLLIGAWCLVFGVLVFVYWCSLFDGGWLLVVGSGLWVVGCFVAC